MQKGEDGRGEWDLILYVKRKNGRERKGEKGKMGEMGEPRLKFNNSSPSCVLRALSHH